MMSDELPEQLNWLNSKSRFEIIEAAFLCVDVGIKV